jgi:biotin carboxyl carrier protein
MRWCALLLIWTACSKSPPAETTSRAETGTGASAEPSSPVRWTAVRRPAEDGSLFVVPAVVGAAPAGRASVAAPVTVRVLAVPVRPGDVVQAGDVVVEVAAPELAQAIAVRRSAEARIVAHQKHLAGLRQLHKDGLLRAGEVFEIEAKLADLQAARAEAEAKLRGVGLDERELTALAATGRWPLRTPIAGTVREVQAVPGAVVAPPERMAQIEGLQPARIEARLQQDLPSGAQWSFEQADGALLPLQPTPTARLVDAADGSTQVWFDAATPTALPAGTRGRLRMTAWPADVWAVPVRALGSTAAGATVRKWGVEAPVPVKVWGVAGGVALVRGLQAGDQVAESP